jgi:DNA-binding NtrC family response regulator
LNLNEKNETESREISLTEKNFSDTRNHLIREFERNYIVERLTETKGNVSEAAKISGVKRQSFQRLMKNYNIYSKDFKPI